MFRPVSCLSRYLLASAVAFVTSASAVASAQPAPSPVPVPYPLAEEVRAVEPLSAAEAAGRVPFPCWPPLKCILKNSASVDGPTYLQFVAAPGDDGGNRIDVAAWSWGGPNVQPPDRGSADPQEGGEVAKRGVGRASVSEITPTKKSDKSSPVLLSGPSDTTAYREPGKLEIPNLGVASPLPSGTLTVRLARGAVAKGTHIPAVKLSTKGREYRLHDVVVTECQATSDNTDTCLLGYGSFGG